MSTIAQQPSSPGPERTTASGMPVPVRWEPARGRREADRWFFVFDGWRRREGVEEEYPLA